MLNIVATRLVFQRVRFARLLNSTVKFPLSSFSNRSEVIEECEALVDYSTFITKIRQKYSEIFSNSLFRNPKEFSANNIIETLNSYLYSKNFIKFKNDSIIVLLLSAIIIKGIEQKQDGIKNNNVSKSLIIHNHNVLADVNMILQIAVSIHKDIRILLPNESKIKPKNNKLLLLVGDYMFSECNRKLAEMRHNDIYFIILSAFKDMICANFEDIFFSGPPKYNIKNEDRIINNMSPMLKEEYFLEHPKNEWVARKICKGPLLLGRSCQGSALIANLNELSEKAFNFGCYLGLAWQAANELEDLFNADAFCLTSAPVLFAINKNPDLYKTIIEEGKEDLSNIDYLKLKTSIFNTDAIAKTKILIDKFAFEVIKFSETMSHFDEDDKFVSILKRLVYTY